MEVENPFFESARVVPSCHEADTITAGVRSSACFDGGTTNVVSGRRKSDCEWPVKSGMLKGDELLRKRAYSLEKFKHPVPLVAGNDADFKKEPIPPPPEENGGLPRKLSFLSQMIRGSSSTSLQDACSSQDGDNFKAIVFVEGELTTSPVEFDISRSSNIEFLIVTCLRKYEMEKRIPRLDNSRLSLYSLRVAEEDGSIDTDFPVLAKNQPLDNFTHIRQFVLCVGQHYDVSPKTVPRTRRPSGVKSGDPDRVQVVNTMKSQHQRDSLVEMDKRWSHGMVMRPSGSPNVNSASDLLKNYLKRLCFGAQIGSSPP